MNVKSSDRHLMSPMSVQACEALQADMPTCQQTWGSGASKGEEDKMASDVESDTKPFCPFLLPSR